MPRLAGFDRFQHARMPLRDALRGVSRLAEATESALEPAARLLPDPIRAPFHNALKSMGRVGSRLTDTTVNGAQIERARLFLTGADRTEAALMDCVRSLAHGWDALTREGPCHDDTISETLLADLLARQPKNTVPGPEQAAQLLVAINRSGAIARMPSLGPVSDPNDRALVLVAVGVWLLTSRADTPEGEGELLALAYGLVRAMNKDAREALNDPARLGAVLTDWAAHL